MKKIVVYCQQFRIDDFYKDFSCQRVYDCPVKYANESISQLFVDYLGRTYFNSALIELTKKKEKNVKI